MDRIFRHNLFSSAVHRAGHGVQVIDAEVFQCYSHCLAAHTHAKSEILHLIGLFKLLMLYYRKDEEIVDH